MYNFRTIRQFHLGEKLCWERKTKKNLPKIVAYPRLLRCPTNFTRTKMKTQVDAIRISNGVLEKKIEKLEKITET